MKKKIITVLLAMSMAVRLAACGSASSSNTDSKNPSDTESAETAKSSDDSKSDTSSKSVPSEVTEDNISDFPVTDESEFELEISKCDKIQLITVHLEKGKMKYEG